MSTADLSQILDQWLRRLRLQRMGAWLQRGLALGLGLGFLVGTLGLLSARLLRTEYLLLVLGCAVLAALLSALVAYRWPIQRLRAARYFDRLFHLQERVSTALELNSTGSPSSRLLQQQLEDARDSAKKVETASALPIRFLRWEALVSLVFLLLSVLVLARGQSWFQAAQQARQVEQAVQEQTAEIQQILKDIQANPNLTEQQKQELSKPLEEALQGLQADPSQEGSVSVLVSTSEKLQALSDPAAMQTSQALQDAAQQLEAQPGSPLESVGKQLEQGNAMSAAAELRNIDVSQLSEAERQQLADQLQSLAQSLAASNPALSSQLQQAAQALEQGDLAAAQQALEDASKSLSQAGQQLLVNQLASETASQLQEGAGKILAAGGGAQTAQQPQAPPGSSNQPGQNQQSPGGGSGKGSTNQDSGPGSEAGSVPIPQQNGPGDGGESTYEPIYAPSLIGGDQGPSVGLPSSGDQGTVIGQGPTTPSDPGQSLVPYSEVYSLYDEINQQAIESGYVPLEFLQIIRSYFDSLEP